ncbi:hypothetical protein MnTg02_02692 [bacterium MnTg02]|nr:hypothetical protein MnTg02_02692 [bacterium MnTg02]
MLYEFFRAPVKETDMRINPLHDLSIKFENETQNAMSRRMLRTEIDAEISDFCFGHRSKSLLVLFDDAGSLLKPYRFRSSWLFRRPAEYI